MDIERHCLSADGVFLARKLTSAEPRRIAPEGLEG